MRSYIMHAGLNPQDRAQGPQLTGFVQAQRGAHARQQLASEGGQSARHGACGCAMDELEPGAILHKAARSSTP